MSEKPSPTSTQSLPSEEESVVNDEVSEYERKLVQKLDAHIVPVVMLLYLLSFLDRLAKKKCLRGGVGLICEGSISVLRGCTGSRVIWE